MSYVVIDPPAVYLATCGAEVFADGPDLEALLARVRESLMAGEDAAVWRGDRLVCVVRAGGDVYRFSP